MHFGDIDSNTNRKKQGWWGYSRTVQCFVPRYSCGFAYWSTKIWPQNIRKTWTSQCKLVVLLIQKVLFGISWIEVDMDHHENKDCCVMDFALAFGLATPDPNQETNCTYILKTYLLTCAHAIAMLEHIRVLFLFNLLPSRCRWPFLRGI